MSINFDRLSDIPTTDVRKIGDKFLMTNNDNIKFLQINTSNCGGAGYYTADLGTMSIVKTDMPASTAIPVGKIEDAKETFKDVKEHKLNAKMEAFTTVNDLFEDIINNKRVYISASLDDMNAVAVIMGYAKLKRSENEFYLMCVTPAIGEAGIVCPKEYFDKIKGEVYELN